MEGVTDLLRIFGNEQYMLTYSGSGGGGGRDDGLMNQPSRQNKRSKAGSARGVASVILHKNATGAETAIAILALVYFQDELANAGFSVVGALPPAATTTIGRRNNNTKPKVNGSTTGVAQKIVSVEGRGEGKVVLGAARTWERSTRRAGGRGQPSPAELRRCLQAARRRASDGAPGFFAALNALGWSTEKFMFGNIKARVEWRL